LLLRRAEHLGLPPADGLPPVLSRRHLERPFAARSADGLLPFPEGFQRREEDENICFGAPPEAMNKPQSGSDFPFAAGDGNEATDRTGHSLCPLRFLIGVIQK